MPRIDRNLKVEYRSLEAVIPYARVGSRMTGFSYVLCHGTDNKVSAD